MKLQLMVALLVFTHVSIAQGSADEKMDMSFSKVFLLDELTMANDIANKHDLSGTHSFLQIEEGKIIFHYRVKNKMDGYRSELKELNVSLGADTIEFTGNNLYKQERWFKGKIIIEANGKVKVHVYTSIGSYERFFNGHEASTDEMNILRDAFERK